MRFSAEKLQRFAADVMKQAGLCDNDAEVFAEALLDANLRGVASHGITRLGVYTKRIEAGVIKTGQHLKILEESPSTYAFDACDGVGAVMGREMTDLCIRKAKDVGSCVATAKNGTHWGVASFYTKYAAKQGLVALAFCNSEAAVVPFGGAKPMLGTNPLSCAIPAAAHEPLVLDMATSMVARGKVVQAQKEGRSIPDTWCVDANGGSTTDPNAALGGAMLPFGGAKGYGISLIIDIICSCLGGALDSRKTNHFWDNFTDMQNVGYFMCLIDVSKFLPLSMFCAKVDALIEEMKACPPAPGFKEVMIPGEIEDRNYVKNLKEGIELADSLVTELKQIGEKHQVPFPSKG